MIENILNIHTLFSGNCTSPPHKRQRYNSERSRGTTRGRGSRNNSKRGRPKKPSFHEEINSTTEENVSVDESVNTILVKDLLPIRAVSEGEELVRIQKVAESEDSDIEIDDPDSPINQMVQERIEIKQDIKEEIIDEIKEETEEELTENITINNETNLDKLNSVIDNYNSECKEQSERVFDLPTPKQEITLDPESITEEEKEIHHEFFLGRATKTPNRYLKVNKINLYFYNLLSDISLLKYEKFMSILV